MKPEELTHILNKGEGTTIEYKIAQGGIPVSLYETVVSFSNTDGGIIVLGSDNDGNIKGIEENDLANFHQVIAANLNNKECVNPPLYLQPITVKHPDGNLIIIRVPASSQLHDHAGKYFFRSDDNDQDITGNQNKISEIYYQKREYFSESTIYPFLSMDDLDPELFQKARAIIKTVNSTHPWLQMNDLDILASASLYRTDYKTGEQGFTLAAALIFGNNKTISNLLPGYKVDALVRVENLDRYDDRLLLRTNLIDTYLQLLDFVKRHLPEKFFTEDGQRKDLRELIFREVIGNVIVHREYTNAHSSELIIYKDQVKVTNPNKALFHGPLDLDQFNPYPKNPNIRKFFTAFGWTDELGSGVRNTKKYLNSYVPGAKPVFIENDTFITQIPLVNITLHKYHNELVELFDFSDEISGYLNEILLQLPLPTDLNEADWETVLLRLVPSWTKNGARLDQLDWPKNQAFTEEAIKMVPSWAQNGAKLFHRKTNYLIRILLLTIEPITLEDLMRRMEYSKRQTFRENYLLPLQEVGFVNMTIPDTPSSPKQKYILTEKGKQFLTARL
ncbi:AlbA family DNA-binding domain-containing protein [Lutibacter maritimus]|uniref:Putative DNA-binding domain-containing protein n=1 Tax=Lutibacter maritimus TaxID=593133 RepID=A0A1I6SQM8_9FLAO|nr:RNA-binding domain-containing protein [Lutibacter maritimus]SFS79226.1 Putative DNA-binding domain-containing protein [Lutibacter maritimus]